jgi:ParB-like chromosome segregation protein Spo0J
VARDTLGVQMGEERVFQPPGTSADMRPAAGSPDVHEVDIDSLSSADSPRQSGEDAGHTIRLAETADVLPPILVHRPTMRVIDGMHRVLAARQRGRETIRAEFFDGSAEDAFIQAVQANVRHGLPLILADRKLAAARILRSHPHLSDRTLAGYTGLSDKTVAAIRRSTPGTPQLNSRLGADGRRRPLSGRSGRQRAADFIGSRPDAGIREIAATAGISVGTAHDLRTRIRRGEEPTATGSPREPADRAQVPTRRPGVPGNGMILQSLLRDPAMRHTDSGRELLRWLHAHALRVDAWPGLISSVPPHRVITLAKLARRCAESWRQFATELELKVEQLERGEHSEGPHPSVSPRRFTDQAYENDMVVSRMDDNNVA